MRFYERIHAHCANCLMRSRSFSLIRIISGNFNVCWIRIHSQFFVPLWIRCREKMPQNMEPKWAEWINENSLSIFKIGIQSRLLLLLLMVMTEVVFFFCCCCRCCCWWYWYRYEFYWFHGCCQMYVNICKGSFKEHVTYSSFCLFVQCIHTQDTHGITEAITITGSNMWETFDENEPDLVCIKVCNDSFHKIQKFISALTHSLRFVNR